MGSFETIDVYIPTVKAHKNVCDIQNHIQNTWKYFTLVRYISIAKSRTMMRTQILAQSP